MGEALNRGTAEHALCEACPFSRDGRPNHPVFAEYPDDPMWFVIGEGPGFNEVRLGRPFCLVPETLVLMADLTWRELDDVRIGDRILTVDESSNPGNGASGHNARRWRIAEVTAWCERVGEAIEVETEQGNLIGSDDHQVLVRNGGNHSGSSGATSWLEMGKLQATRSGRTSRIVFFERPWKQNFSYEAAWLAGFLEGEGHVFGSRPDLKRSSRKRSKSVIAGFTQNAGAVYDRAVEMVRAVGFELNSKEKNPARTRKGVTCYTVAIRGGLNTTARFLGEIRAERLVKGFQVAVEDRSVRDFTAARVWSRKKIGTRRLIDITTTAGTFIANGFVVHNCGATGQVVNRILAKIGRPREHVYVTNSTLCQPPQGSPVEEREVAAQCCKPRLQSELAEFPGKPVLTLGAVAARALIPKEILDAIDPPDVPKSKKRAAKDKQKAAHKENQKRRKKIERLARKRFTVMLKYRRDQIRHEAIRANGKKPTIDYLDREVQRGRTVMWQKAWKDGIAEFEQKEREAELRKQRGEPDPNAKPAKPKKHKPIKITDIVGTLFDIDVDGTGERPVIPTIHPAALLRGGGASIGGSHTPDMAFVNIIYDAAKVDALAKGKDVRLKVNVEIEVEDRERATRLFLNALQTAFDEGAFTIDLETYVDNPDKHHALMTYVARIRVIGISTNKRSISVMWDLLEPAVISYFQLALAKLVTAYHNGLYDRTVLRAHGFILPSLGIDEDVPEWHDTLLGHHAAFPGNSHRLQTVTAQFFGVKPWKSEFRNAEETPDKLATYNALDTGGTHALVPVITLQVKKTQTERIYARDRRMSDIASRMHIAGMPVDREVNAQLVGTFTRLAYEAKRVVDDKANDPKIQDAIKHHLAIQLAAKKRKADSDEFEDRYNIRLADLRAKGWRWNANNSKHVAALLQAMGVSLFQTTEGGAISTKKDVLEGLVEVPIVRDILKARENFKMLDFVAPMFDQCDADGHITRYGFCDEEDRCHPIWSIHKISGRWAGSEPHGVSNPPREKTRKVLIGSELLRPDSIILEVYCKHCKQQQHDRTDHVFEIGEVLYAERPTTKRQFKAKNGRVIVGFDFCLAPETRVLTAGLRWVRIDSLQRGDELIGFDEEIEGVGHSHKFRRSIVEKVQRFTRPCARITTNRGEIVASLEHSFVRRHAGRARHWAKVSELRVGDQMIFFTDPWPDRHGWEEGYMAGFLDGEGWISGSNTGHRVGGGAGFAQNEGPTLDRVLDILRRRGYEFSLNKSKTGCVRVLPMGEWQSARMVGEFQPPRLLAKSHLIWEGRRTWSTNSRPAEILKIEMIGEQEVVAIRTSTKTFIAEGFLSHNCQIEARIIALLSGDPFMCEVFNRVGGDLHTECAIDVFPGFKDRPAPERKMMRTVCKTLEYATWYGANDEKVWKGLLKEGYNFKLADVSKSLGILRKKMSGVIRWQRETIHKASQPPYTLRDFGTGRMRVWPMGQVEASEALNIVPQSTGAAIMNEGMEKMDMRLPKYKQAFCISQVHDAAYFECWEDDADKIEKDIDECFSCEHTREDGLSMRFTVDIGHGQSLADV